ncbi:MAG: hypothetical protein ABSG95_01240 [Solirubrobacteraceae bacterium]
MRVEPRGGAGLEALLSGNAIAWLEEPERFGDFVQMVPKSG